MADSRRFPYLLALAAGCGPLDGGQYRRYL